MKNPLNILQKIYGYQDFRGQQQAIIEHVIAGNDAFVLMPTGSGKSLCYQIPALCRDGVGIIVSPLIALMHDQVTALQQLGISARTLNSSVDPEEARDTYRQLHQGSLDLLYVSPERLLMDSFLTTLSDVSIALFAIDEAHCVSQWGHDFRPEYAQLSVLAEQFPHVPRMALTATADTPTRHDIIQRLHLAQSEQFIAGFDRPNINYTITENKNAKQQLLRFINDNHEGESGIVYCLSRKKVDDIANWLGEQGLTALPYHAGMSALQRKTHQDRFINEENIIVVATIAFGMGIDKPNVRFVAHLNLPKSIEAYYQETGRAGRDGLPAQAWMAYGLSDLVLLRSFIDDSGASDQQKRIEHQKLNALLGLCETSRCRRQVLLEYFGDSCEACNNCDTCTNPPITFDGTIVAQKALSCVYRTDQRFGIAYLIDVLLGNDDDRMRRFRHDKISTFAVGKECNKTQWQGIFRQLVSQNLLQVDVAGHGGLSITKRGYQFLKEKQTLQLREHRKPTTSAKKSTSTRSKQSLEFDSADDKALFDALKAERLQIAKAQNVPPYVVFHDRTLFELAQHKPLTPEQMASINGVGERKIERYAEDFLAVISDHLQLSDQ